MSEFALLRNVSRVSPIYPFFYECDERAPCMLRNIQRNWAGIIETCELWVSFQLYSSLHLFQIGPISIVLENGQLEGPSTAKFIRDFPHGALVSGGNRMIRGVRALADGDLRWHIRRVKKKSSSNPEIIQFVQPTAPLLKYPKCLSND